MLNTTEVESNTRTIYQVSELNQMVRTLLEEAFPALWVEGEISNFSCPASGHWYFSLKDSKGQIRCAMFQGKNRVLNFQPTNGAHVLVRGKISLYEARGDFQFIADFMEEAGDGALRRAYEILKTKLAKEGLFNPEHKKPLPSIPTCIGVITSPTGAAIRDILSVLKRRYPAIPIIIYPTAVQGDKAPGQIVNAIAIANQRQECDVILLARGGGSLEDLWAFNEEIVAQAIHKSHIPIVSAIGHEIDFTIADFVADQRAATPSAAAELVSPDKAALAHRLLKLFSQLKQQIQFKLSHDQQSLTGLSKRLRHPGQRLRDQMQRVDEWESQLHRLMDFKLKQSAEQIKGLARSLEAVSPLGTLARGYSITTNEKTNAIIENTTQLQKGDTLVTQLKTGRCVSEVTVIMRE